MIKESIKFSESSVFEGMTSIRAVIKAIDEGLSDRRILKVMYDKSKTKKISKEVGYFRAVSSKYNFDLIETAGEELEKITLGTSHGGIVALASERSVPPLSADFIKEKKGLYCMIEGIEDPYNFGYALRSLYALGVSGIILPKRNWLSSAGIVCRSSAGASELLRFASSDATECASFFKDNGFLVVAAHEKTDCVLGKASLPLPLLLIVGGEKRGISKETLKFVDKLVKIDYNRDFKASLSAASATTIFAYEIMRQNT